jgi:hypothetical protein
MPRGYHPRVASSKYTPLVAYLAAQEGEQVTLTVTEIEAIIGAPLSVWAPGLGIAATAGCRDSWRSSRPCADPSAASGRRHPRARQCYPPDDRETRGPCMATQAFSVLVINTRHHRCSFALLLAHACKCIVRGAR